MGRDEMSFEEADISYWHVTIVVNSLWKTLILYQVLKKIVKQNRESTEGYSKSIVR